jgi:hypothetical protein
MFIAGRCRPAMRIAFDAGDCAAHEIFISPAARSDLLFTMSDNPRADRSIRRAKQFTSGRADGGPACDPPGGARRDRTDDLLLAKQALSQLSYGPLFGGNSCRSAKAGLSSRSSRQPSPPSPHSATKTRVTRFRGLRRGSLPLACASEGWWAWEDLNFRPHAYQARALTN